MRRKLMALAMVLAMAVNTAGTALCAAAPDVSFPDVYPEDAYVYYSAEELDTLITAIINTMTREEKLTAVSGDQARTTPRGYGTGAWLGIPRLGVPMLRSYDGPMGVTSPSGQQASLGIRSASIPPSTALA